MEELTLRSSQDLKTQTTAALRKLAAILIRVWEKHQISRERARAPARTQVLDLYTWEKSIRQSVINQPLSVDNIQ